MPRASRSRIALAAALALVLAACQQDRAPTAAAPSGPSAAVQASQGAGAPSADDLDRQIPGFGGFFLDRDGAPTVYLTRGSSRAAAERALGGYLAARGLASAAVRVREARYGWQQLQHWQDVATEDAFQVAGTVFVDNDETSNAVRIGVENPNAAAGQIRAALARHAVPDDAVIIERADPIVQMAGTLQDADRPVRAGVQINFGLYVCSIGFNALSAGGQASFITASHCTNKQGGVEGTKYGQPLLSSGTIATEVDDPVYSKLQGCTGNKVCRYSDASRAAYTDGSIQSLGYIAATGGPNTGSLTISGSFHITSDDCTNTLGGCLPVGATVNKVGRTTGWTQGTITNKCANTGVQGSRIVQLCQTFVSAGVGGGDSGSDVFQITTGTDVMLAGVLWGGNSSGTQFVYSPLANVVKELGALTTH